MSAAPLVEVHHALDELLTLARELTLIGDGARATATLASYRALTAAHAADEEAYLLPLLGADARWPPVLYTGQHAKLLAGLDRAGEAVAAVAPGRAGWRRRALDALDALAPVLHLAHHHHLAEEQDLFPRAAAAAPARLAELAAAWHLVAAAHDGLLADARAALAAHDAALAAHEPDGGR